MRLGRLLTRWPPAPPALPGGRGAHREPGSVLGVEGGARALDWLLSLPGLWSSERTGAPPKRGPSSTQASPPRDRAARARLRRQGDRPVRHSLLGRNYRDERPVESTVALAGGEIFATRTRDEWCAIVDGTLCLRRALPGSLGEAHTSRPLGRQHVPLEWAAPAGGHDVSVTKSCEPLHGIPRLLPWAPRWLDG